MSDPRRLFEDDDLAKELLGAARTDGPSKHARDRAAIALGLGVGTAAATTAISTKAAATTAKVAGVGLWTKVGAAFAITAAVAGGGAVVVKQQQAAPTASAVAPPPRAPSRVANVAAPREQAAPTVEAAPAVAASSLPDEVAAPKLRAKPPSSSLSVLAPAGTADGMDPDLSPLARETRVIDLARKQLDGGDPAGALAMLDRHDRMFPNGALRTEASVLRVDALVAKGDRPAAKKLAAELLARDPSGPHARHLRSVSE